MNNLSDIKRRIDSVKQTRQITGAMETVSIAKLRKATELCENNRAYFDLLCGVVKDMVAHADADVKEFLAPPKAGVPLFVVVASDKGLCGSFNHDIFRLADAALEENCAVAVVGRTAAEHYSMRQNTDMRFADSLGGFDYNVARQIADYILRGYGTEFSSVSIVYTHNVSKATHSPRVLDILPIATDVERDEQHDVQNSAIEFEPSPIEVIEKLMPLYVGGVVYGAVINSIAAEHGARRAAMSAATENADTVIDELSVEYNRARQGVVTSQITEIIGSSQALSGKGGSQ